MGLKDLIEFLKEEAENIQGWAEELEQGKESAGELVRVLEAHIDLFSMRVALLKMRGLTPAD